MRTPQPPVALAISFLDSINRTDIVASTGDLLSHLG
jgi:hypothetical protein